MGGNRRIDGPRLWQSLMDMAAIGATADGGVRRLALTEVDAAGRALFAHWCTASGLSLRTDAMGNMFARRQGATDAPPVLIGSHLDSQPSGGKFDGALGVLAGLEVLRTLDDLDIRTERPVELVNWTDEEGARFGRAMLGSGVWSGVFDAAVVAALRDADGITLADALVPLAGEAPCAPFPADSYFELHIEQGPILERASATIGIVTGAQAQIWYGCVARGQESHAGTTPPEARRDALVAAAGIVTLIDRFMRDTPDARGTVGRLTVSPGSPNVIPGEVAFSAEFRHPDDAALVALDARFRAEAPRVAADAGCSLEVEPLFRLAAQHFDPACVALVEDAARAHGFPARRLVSGAGHDAVYVARKIPAAMVFVPCRDGLSHNPAEAIEPEHAAAGAQVLLDCVLARAGSV